MTKEELPLKSIYSVLLETFLIGVTKQAFSGNVTGVENVLQYNKDDYRAMIVVKNRFEKLEITH